MALQLFLLHVLAVILLQLQAVNPFSLRYPAVFNFGDSNSDTGGLVAGVAFPIGLPDGETYFQEASGRFCDGRLIIDFLRDEMGQPFLSPYLDSVGAPNFATGCNFATGGATIFPANAAATNPFSLDIQVSQFFRFKARVLRLLDEDKNMQEYLPTEDYFNRGLYMFDIGQNDLDGAFSFLSEKQVFDFILTILSQFQTGIKKLYDAGARNFWIHNTGPLGCLPRIIAKYGKDSSKLDQLGCVKSHNNAAYVFNLKLHEFYVNFQVQFPEANVTYVDIFTIKLNLISNFSQYGFKEPLAACCGYGGPPLNFDSEIGCGQTKNLNGSKVMAKPCDDTSEYVNWDGTHYTEAANRFVAQQIITGNYSYYYQSMSTDVLIDLSPN